ncbi:unnamed protein product [Darwinula stevensoni]|uniref:Kazal-like domain-containing protein n=1 Tax=Darwinula stevensoni TaxID=69355 RepID=A0A7R8XAX8_9CRUS|nr:unnamed protein product [Darwinula stevensoni]CAG0887169.1 unnamed protein product [Darwinula stevensoni]
MRKPEALCRCEEKNMVCGTNGETYKTICALRTAAAGTEEGEQPRLELASWGPCKMSPCLCPPVYLEGRGRSRFGVRLLLFICDPPPPTDSQQWSLGVFSGDYTTIAVQTRGGPERLMVSGWVQVMDIQPGDGGLYTCVAVNELGEARATANIGVYKGTEENTTEEEEEVEENDI